jgi:putative regulator of septum formation/uncharacterized protein DUF4190
VSHPQPPADQGDQAAPSAYPAPPGGYPPPQPAPQQPYGQAPQQPYGQAPQQSPYGPPPAYGAPTGYGAPPPYGAYPLPKPGFNGFAIASLVISVFGGVLLSVVFGIIALVQTRRSGQKGRGLAIAGLAISSLWLVGIAVGVIIAIASSADRDSTGNITAGGDVSAFDLKVGDCLNDLKEGQSITDLPAVPCAQPHEGEVFAVFDLPAGAYPGEAKVSDDAERECANRFEGYAPSSVDDTSIELFFLHPTQLSWAQGDHEVTCVATDPTKKRTGSLRG